MRILYVVLRLYDKPRQAIIRRHAAIANALTSLGHEVKAFPLTNEDATAIVRPEPTSVRTQRGTALHLMDPMTTNALLQELESGRYDAVILTHPYCTEFTVHAQRMGIPSVVCAHNFEGSRQMKISRRRSLLGHVATVAAEALYLKQATRLWTVSPRDESSYRKAFHLGNTRYLPIGLDLMADYSAVYGARPTVAFVGTFSYLPNQLAATEITRSIFPLVIRSVPNAELILAGSRPGRDITALGGAGITIIPDVDQIDTVYRTSDVILAPIRVGGGSNFKVLEGMAYGKTVIASPKAIKGLSPSPEGCVVEADSVETFASQVVKMLTDPVQRAEIGQRAREYVSLHYSSDRLREILDQELRLLDKDSRH